MNAQEFRIGNLVSRLDLGDHSLRVESILELRKDKVLTTGPISVICLYSEIKPIPLTEEWFLKFGFHRIDPEIRGKTFALGVTFEFWKGSGYGWFPFISMNKYQFNEILYVHQLQNFYFILTGEELTL